MEQSQQQKYLVIGLVVVALVLVAVIGYLVMNSNKSADVATATGTTTPATTGQTGGTTGATTGQSATPSTFDPKTATKVPSGSDPKKFVDEYYAAVMQKDYTTAFKHLPADKQQGSSADALKQQIEGYGITGYSVTGATQQGDTYTVTADQVTSQYGTFANTWIFVKDGKVWALQSKAVTGMK